MTDASKLIESAEADDWDEEEGDLLSIEDLIARAELEPNLADIYVEGSRDAEMLRLVLQAEGIEAEVYPVSDRLKVLRSEVELVDEEYGNRSKLLAASAHVDTARGVDGHRFSFFVDADWTTVRGPQVHVDSSLIVTDVPAMEHYYLQSDSFAKTLQVGLERSDISPDEVRVALKGALRDVAIARLVLKDLHIACIDKFATLCVFKNGTSSANSMEIILRSINGAGRGRDIKELNLEERVATYRGWLDAANHPGRGHDIAPLLSKLLRLRNLFGQADALEVLMRTGVEIAEISALPVVRRLVARLQGPSSTSTA